MPEPLDRILQSVRYVTGLSSDEDQQPQDRIGTSLSAYLTDQERRAVRTNRAQRAEGLQVRELYRGYQTDRLDRKHDPELESAIHEYILDGLQAATPDQRSKAMYEMLKHGINGLQFVGEQMDKWLRLWGSTFAFVDGLTRQEKYENENVRQVMRQGLMESWRLALESDPRAPTIGEFIIPPEVAGNPLIPGSDVWGVRVADTASNLRAGKWYQVPLGYVMTPAALLASARLGHTRIIFDIGLDPSTYLTFGVGFGSKATVGTVGKLREVALSGRGLRTQAEIQSAYLQRATDVMRKRYRRMQARGEWHPQVGGPLDEEGKLLVDAMERAQRASTIRTRRVLDQRITNDPTLLDPGGIKFMGRSLLSGERAGAPVRAAVDAITSQRPFSSVHASKLGLSARRVTRDVDASFNELGREVRSRAGAAHAKAQERAVVSQSYEAAAREVNRLTTNVPDDALADIHRYMQYRVSQPEKAAELYPRVQQYNDVINRADDVLHSMFLRERWKRAGHNELPDYTPHLFSEDPEDVRRIFEAMETTLSPRQKSGGSVGATADFVHHRMFPDMDAAVEYAAKTTGQTLTPRWNIREALLQRASQHARFIGRTRRDELLLRDWAVTEHTVNRLSLARALPRLRRGFSRRLAISAPAMTDRVGAALRAHEAGQVPRKLLKKMPEAERALYLYGAMDSIKNYGDLARFVERHGRWLDDIDSRTMTKVREELGIHRESFADEFGRDWVKVADTPENGVMAGVRLPMAMVEDIQDIGGFNKLPTEVRRGISRWERYITDPFRLGTTVVWPAFAARNAYSDFDQILSEISLAALNPRKWKMATDIVRGKGPNLDIGGIKAPAAYFQNEMFRLGVVKQFGQLSDLAGHDVLFKKWMTSDVETVPWRSGQGVIRAITAPPRSLARAQTFRENQFRTFLWTHYVSQGVSPEVAAARVNDIMFDYQSLSKVDRQVKVAVPYWTWSKKNFALQADRWRRRPGVQAAHVKALSQDYGPDEAFLPDYMSGKLKVGVERDGKRYFLSGIDLPISAAMDLSLAGNMSELAKNWFSMLHPVPSTMLEAMVFQKDAFTGAPVPMTKVASHIAIKGFFLSRAVSTARRFNEYLDDPHELFSLAAALDMLGGFRLQEFDLNDREAAVAWRNVRLLRARMEKMEGIPGGTKRYEKWYIPKKKREAAE